MNITTPLSEIKSLVQDARDVARREASKHYSCLRSRGMHIFCCDGDNNLFEAESYEWNGTKKDLQNAIKYVQREWPSKTVTFGIQGGFNGADSIHDLNDFNYDAWVSEWSIELFNGVVTVEVSE